MSRTIDEKVVEMRFDNRDFESHVSESMGTLDKLKKSLDFSNAQDSFSGLTSAANKVNFSGLTGALETVGNKFSALETIAVGALMNIGATIESKLVGQLKSLSLEPIMEGFGKYETKSKAVQTIMNATGKEIDEVSDALAKLNWYTDETSYDFAEMVTTVGKFTSAGVELKDALTAMQGIANWAGISGADKEKANMAFYNLAQALGLGYVGAGDYRSIMNANMDTQAFKQMVIEEALKEGTLAVEQLADGTEKFYAMNKETQELIYANEKEGELLEVSLDNFYGTLTKGKWFDKEVLMNTLKKYGQFSELLNKFYEDVNSQDEYDVTTHELITFVDAYRDGTLDINEAMNTTGMSAEYLTKILSTLASTEYELSEKAFKAANESRTLGDAISATKDAVSTAWMNTFEILFGNYEEAKELWGELADELWDIFAGPITEINHVLLGWKNLGGRADLIQSIKNLYHAVRNITDPIGEAWEKIFPSVDSSGLSNFTANLESFTSKLVLTEDHVSKISKAFEGFFGGIKFVKDAIGDLIGAFTEESFKGIGGFVNGILNGLQNVGGWIEKTIALIKRMAYAVDVGWTAMIDRYGQAHPILLGIIRTFEKLKDTISIFGGYISRIIDYNRLIETFANEGGGIAGVAKVIAVRFSDIIRLIEEMIHLWTGIDTSDIFDPIVNKVFGLQSELKKVIDAGHFDIIKNGIKSIGEEFKKSFGGIESFIGPILKSASNIFKDWVEGIELILGGSYGGFENFFVMIENGLSGVQDFVKNNEGFSLFINGIKNGIAYISGFLTKFLSLKSAIAAFKEAGGGLDGIFAVIKLKIRQIIDLAADLIQKITGIDIHGIGDVVVSVFDKIYFVVEKAIESLRNFFGFFKKDNTSDIIDLGDKTEKTISPIGSLFDGLKDLFGGIWSVLKKLKPVFDIILTKVGGALSSIGNFLNDIAENIDVQKILDVVGKGLKVAFGVGIVRFIHSLSGPFEQLGGIFKNVKKVLKEVQGCLEAWQLKLKSDVLLKIASAIGILALSLIALSTVDPDKLKVSLSVITALMIELVGAFGLGNEFSGNKKSFVGTGTALLEMAISLLIVASVIKKLGNIDWDVLSNGLFGMMSALAMLTIASIALSKFGGGTVGNGAAIILIATSLKIMASALEDFGNMNWDAILRGLVAMTVVLGEVIAAAILMSNFAGAGSLLAAAGIAAIAAALILLAVPLEIMSNMGWEELIKGLIAIGGSLIIIGAVGTVFGPAALSMMAFAAGLAAVSAALLLLTPSLILIGSMSLGEILKSLLGIAGAFVVIGGLGALLGTVAPMIVLFGAALAVVSAALLLLTPSLLALGSMSMEQIGHSLLELAGAFAIIGIAGLVFGPISPLIMAFAVAVGILGVAMVGVGAGLSMFAAGLAALAASGSAGLSMLTLAITSVASLIPIIIRKIGEGLIEIIKMTGERAETIADTILKVTSKILDVITELVPKIANTVAEIIDGILKALADHLPSIINSISEILLAILDGIAEYLPKFIQAGIDIVLSLVEGIGNGLVENAERTREAFRKLFQSIIEAILVFLGVDNNEAHKFAEIATSMIGGLTKGIAENAMRVIKKFINLMNDIIESIKEGLPEFIEKGKEMMLSIKTGISEKIEEVKNKFEDAVLAIINGARDAVQKAKDIGTDIMDGMKNGISEGKNKVVSFAAGVGNKVLDVFRDVFDSHSPSEETKKIGEDVDNGLIKGLTNKAPLVFDTVSKIGGTIVNKLKTMLNGAADEVKSFLLWTKTSVATATATANTKTSLLWSKKDENNIEASTKNIGENISDWLFGGAMSNAESSGESFADWFLGGAESELASESSNILSNFEEGISSYLDSGTLEDYGELGATQFTDGATTVLDGYQDAAYDQGVASGENWTDGFAGEIEGTTIQGPTITPVINMSEVDDLLHFTTPHGNVDFHKNGELEAFLTPVIDGVGYALNSVEQAANVYDMLDKGLYWEAIQYAQSIVEQNQQEARRNYELLIGSYSAENASQSAAVMEQNAQLAAEEHEFLTQQNEQLEASIDENTAEIVGLREETAEVGRSLRSLKIVMDTGVLVGEITPEIDRALANRTVFVGRGI